MCGLYSFKLEVYKVKYHVDIVKKQNVLYQPFYEFECIIQEFLLLLELAALLSSLVFHEQSQPYNGYVGGACTCQPTTKRTGGHRLFSMSKNYLTQFKLCATILDLLVKFTFHHCIQQMG